MFFLTALLWFWKQWFIIVFYWKTHHLGQSLTFKVLADFLKISNKRIVFIVLEHLTMKKLFTKWIPRGQNNKVSVILKLFRRDRMDFLRRHVTSSKVAKNTTINGQSYKVHILGYELNFIHQPWWRPYNQLGPLRRQVVHLKDEIVKNQPHIKKKIVFFH